MKHFRGLALAGLFAFFLVCAFSAGAQESGSDIDALFGDEVLVESEQPSQGTSEQVTATTSAIDPLQGLLKTEAVKIGGSLTGKIGATWTWNDPWNSGFDLLNPDTHALDPALQGLVYFDARPSEDFRVHGSVKTAWPFRVRAVFGLGRIGNPTGS